MKNTAQHFAEIQDIVDNLVLLRGGNACLVIQVQASNFALLSKDEQDAKITAYASFLNSLSFPIQILIQNKKIDISSYIRLLNAEAQSTKILHPTLSAQQNKLLVNHIVQYRDFVAQLVKENTVLDKQFYLTIPFSYLERGAATVVKGGTQDSFITASKSALNAKADSILSQLSRLSLRARKLEKEELIKLFYNVYNQRQSSVDQLTTGIETPVVTGPKNV